VVLWLQDGWGWSALRSGLAIAPGPLMVPLFAAVGQRLSARVSAGALISAGCLLFGVGALLMLASVQVDASYAGAVLPGWLVAGVGVGLTLPTILTSATRDLPPQQASTGSAVVNTTRQLGTVLGVSVLVAVLGSPVSPEALLDGVRTGWAVVAGVSFVAAVAALGMRPRG
jgi:hypothetical protein